MSIPDLDLTVRLLGLPVPEVWSRYLAVGGSSTLRALRRRIAGQASWSSDEDLFLAVALSDALLDASLVALNPLKDLLDALGPRHGWSPAAGRAAGQAGVVVVGPVDLDQLIVRAQEARASAQRIRQAAEEARRRVTATTRDLVRSTPPAC